MKGKVFLALVGTFLIAGTVFLISEGIKRQPGFCVFCHIDANTPLHAEKQRRFLGDPPANLASEHRKKAAEDFGCAACHAGASLQGRARLVVAETKNLYLYLFGDIEEPKKMDQAQMPDENCTSCHAEIKPGKGRFHGFSAHRPMTNIRCIVCHRSHVPGSRVWYFMDLESLMAVCRKCHMNIPAGFSMLPRTAP